MEITLEQLLNARDERHEMQLRLIEDYPESTLVVLTIVVPGSEKRTADSMRIADEAVSELRKAFAGSIDKEIIRDLQTGFEAYFLIPKDEKEAKIITSEIEDTHPLGRLFDIDIIGKDGVPMTRSAIGKAGRKCLLCDEDARVCMRKGTHTRQQVIDKIHQMTDEYFQQH